LVVCFHDKARVQGKQGKRWKKIIPFREKSMNLFKRKISVQNQGISPRRPKSMKTLDVNISLFV
jgi:hypothetical protein